MTPAIIRLTPAVGGPVHKLEVDDYWFDPPADQIHLMDTVTQDLVVVVDGEERRYPNGEYGIQIEPATAEPDDEPEHTEHLLALLAEQPRIGD